MFDQTSQHDLLRSIDGVRAHFSGVMGIAAKNLATGEEVLVEADRSFPTASVFKIPVMVEIFRLADSGALRLDERIAVRASDIVPGSGVLRALVPGIEPSIHDLLTLMIIVSDNSATNMLIDRAGGVGPINELMQGKLGLSSILIRDRIDFQRIRTEHDHIAETSPRDMMRLCELIAREELVSPGASREMLAIMRQQHYLNQFPRYLAYNPYGPELGEPQQIFVANKTGSLPGTRADAGIIGLPGDVRIAYCVMTENSVDTGFTSENEGEIANGLIGRLLIEHWWPGTSELPSVDSPYLLPARASENPATLAP